MIRKRFFLLPGVLCLSLLVTSCFTVGQPFPSLVTWIKPNQTTKADIEKAFGPPFRMGYDSGHLTYSYGYYKYSAFPIMPQNAPPLPRASPALSRP